MKSSFILNFLSKFDVWKGRHFYGRPRAALSFGTPLSGVAKGGRSGRSAPGGTFMGAALWAKLL